MTTALGWSDPGGRRARHLGDDRAAGVPGGHRHVEHAQGEGVALERDVSVLVRGRPLDDGHVDRLPRIEERLFAPQGHELGERRPGRPVHAAPLPPGIDERVDADRRHEAGASGRRRADPREDRAHGQVVGLDGVLRDELVQLLVGVPAEGPGDHPPHQIRLGQPVHAGALAAAPGAGPLRHDRVDDLQPSGPPRLEEARLERRQDGLGHQAIGVPGEHHGRLVADLRRGLGGAHEGSHADSSTPASLEVCGHGTRGSAPRDPGTSSRARSARARSPPRPRGSSGPPSGGRP